MIRVLRYRPSRELGRRRAALVAAFAHVRREVWTRRERDLRWHLELGANWTIA